METLMQRLQFFLRFTKSPAAIGSVTPSSRFLVHTLIKPVNWARAKVVVELGAGTGVVTLEIERNLNSDGQAVIFESDPKLSLWLKRNHPALIHCSDARFLVQELEKRRLGQADAIISCLPFANFSATLRREIMDGIKNVLAPNGVFIQFQYSLQLKPLLQSCFQQVDIQFVPFNLPPAFVYICQGR
ncbi:methyltransferase [Thermoactinomyces daqus]|jgi:phospholipid N-methyltransferase|uniref:Methyltransferase n=2 Tax=Thermoactinomyces TaxID=2023 RepID=A0A7W2AI30_9BACL|nr:MULTISPECIES: methyltransferase [Thermoactinomyces]MBA4543807.1 methyltransferase [Thermoactinomyces daqus]MBH8605405.1 methyltransferase [Thermoactinomyces sp. CICC 10522]